MTTRALLVSTAVLFLFSCSRDAEIVYPDPLFPSQTTLITTLFIHIEDESGKSLANVDVRLGNEYKKTDLEGWVIWQDIKVGSSSYITITKDGYFNSSRRFYPSSGAPNHIRIVLFPRTNKIFFQSSSRQISDLGQGFFLDFPKDAYQFENGEEYNGEVTLITQALNIDDPDMSYKMPGDLTGITSNGLTGRLGSMGMVQVELWSSDGQKLKIKDGMKVDIQFPVAAERVNLVPSTMPMWYFDELQGVWREEGLAILQGNHYVGSVSHFSFWNCDAWFSPVNLFCSFVHNDDAPVAFGQVCITIDRLQARSCDFINQAGEISGRIPANETMTMEVYGICGEKIFTTSIGPYTQDAVEGPISINDQSNYVDVSGRILDCSYQPITKGYVLCTQENNYYRIDQDPVTQSFYKRIHCCGEGDLKFRAFDINTLATSVVYFADFASDIKLDTVQACQKSEEYIYFETPQLELPFFYPFINYKGSGQDCAAVITSEDVLHEFRICLKNRELGYYSDAECWIELQLNPSERAVCNKIDLQITEFGGFHGFIKGTFNGNFIAIDSSEFMYPHFKGGFSVKKD